MRLWIVLWGIVILLVATFAVVNWSVLTAQTTISLIVAQVSAPLGLVMLGAMGALTLLFLLFLLWVETKALVQIPRADRRPTTDATSARVADLRSELERQFGGLHADLEASAQSMMARLDRVEQTVRDEAERAGTRVIARFDRHAPEA